MGIFRLTIPLIVVAACCLLAGCAGSRAAFTSVESPSGYTSPAAAAAEGLAPTINTWPSSLPSDALQPWETADPVGYAVDGRAGADQPHAASCINAQSDFTPGVERFNAAGDVTDLDEASRLASGSAGDNELSYAQYRILMGGEQPGALSADVNLHQCSGGGLSEYWLGLSDYGNGAWEWHGPFSDAHVRLSLPSGDYLSELGNLFVNVVACNGAACDVVGLGVNPRDGADGDAPAAPTGLTATPVAGGLDLAWNGVIAGDLAGYRVYYSNAWFADREAPDLKNSPYLEGNTRHLLLGPATETYVRIAAVDITGNEGELSEIVSATPLSGNAPALIVTTDEVSGYLGLSATLTATGAEVYDWDLDGDGIFEVTGDASGTAQVDTARTGIIRPAVRGLSSGGTAVACGAVSLIVTGNARPVANGYADPSCGPAPLTVNFTGAGSDPDGEIVLYSWDFDGNGSYDWSDPSNSNPPDQVYNMPYMRNVKFRVDDDQGAYDVDTVSVQILSPEENQPPVAKIGTDRQAGNAPLYVNFDAAGSYDVDGSIAKYEWDWDSDGTYDYDAGTDPQAQHVWYNAGFFTVTLRVTDDEGATNTDFVNLTVRGVYTATVDWQDDVGQYCSMAMVNGCPAIAYQDVTHTDLKYVRALDRDGLEWGDPLTVHANDPNHIGEHTSLAVVNGRPAIGYDVWPNNAGVYYVQAADIDGSSWNDPIKVDSGRRAQLILVSNVPALAYLDTATQDAMYLRADDLNGASWTDTPVVVANIDWGSESMYDCLSAAIINGHPAVAFYDMANDCLKFHRADDTLGDAWTGAVVTVDDSGDVGRNPSLVSTDGYPAIAYYDVANHTLRYASCLDYNGTEWRDPIVLDDAAWTGESACLQLVSGHPVISYRRYEYNSGWFSRLRYIRALDLQGCTWGPPVELVNSGDAGFYNSLAQINGNLAISYYAGTNGNLMYALVVE